MLMFRLMTMLGLVLAGGRGWLDAPVLGAIDASPVRERIRVLGAIPDDELPALYGGAAVAAYVRERNT